MESFSITSKHCFRGLFTLPKNISWGNTEMLLCTYCIGQSPKMRNGDGFWHHCKDWGMIIILASSTVGSTSESFSLTRSLPVSLCICLFVCLQQGIGNQDSCWVNASRVSSHHTLSCSPLSFSALSFPACVFASLCSHFPSLLVKTRTVYDCGYSAWQHVTGAMLKNEFTETHRGFVPA